jgi:putative FmdB family regulatory protein
MPQYAYGCLSCQRRFDVEKAATADATLFCPDCGGFCERVFDTAPHLKIVKYPVQHPVEADAVASDTHECGSTCVLHRPASQWPFMDSAATQN